MDASLREVRQGLKIRCSVNIDLVVEKYKESYDFCKQVYTYYNYSGDGVTEEVETGERG